MVRDADGAPGYEVSVGGGLGRTPMIGKAVREFLPKADLLPYLEAILHVYNLLGRRDNKYKARLKILVHEVAIEMVRDRVEAAFLARQGAASAGRTPRCSPRSRRRSRRRPSRRCDARTPPLLGAGLPRLGRHQRRRAQAATHYAIVTVSLKPIGGTPGDATAEQMRLVADLAETYGHDEIRVSHEQNLVLPHVPRWHLPAVYARLQGGGARHRQRRPDLGHHRLPGHGLLRAGDGALDPDRAGDRRGASPTSTGSATSGR